MAREGHGAAQAFLDSLTRQLRQASARAAKPAAALRSLRAELRARDRQLELYREAAMRLEERLEEADLQRVTAEVSTLLPYQPQAPKPYTPNLKSPWNPTLEFVAVLYCPRACPWGGGSHSWCTKVILSTAPFKYVSDLLYGRSGSRLFSGLSQETCALLTSHFVWEYATIKHMYNVLSA